MGCFCAERGSDGPGVVALSASGRPRMFRSHERSATGESRRAATTVRWMSGTVLRLVVAGLLLIELWVATRSVRRQATAADAAVTAEEYQRAAGNAADFLSGLSRSQRQHVARSVLKGRAVTEVGLAAAATAAAHAAGLKWRMSIARPRWILGLVGVFWGSVAVARLAPDHHTFIQILGAVILLGSPWLIHEIVVGPLRRSQRAARAERLNLALVVGPTAESPQTA